MFYSDPIIQLMLAFLLALLLLPVAVALLFTAYENYHDKKLGITNHIHQFKRGEYVGKS